MKKITVDLNIILDFLNKRDNHRQAAEIIELCVSGQVQGYLCAHEITTLSYFLNRNSTQEKTRQIITKLLDLFKIIPITETILRKALHSSIDDYEDSVIEVSSKENEIDYIITQNLTDFKVGEIEAISPADFMLIHQESE